MRYRGGDDARLIHAVLSIRDLPAGQRAALREWPAHYVFDDGAAGAGAHLPVEARGVMGAASPQRDAMIRGFLHRSLGGDG